MAMNSPFSSDRLMSSSTGVAPNDFVTFFNSRKGIRSGHRRHGIQSAEWIGDGSARRGIGEPLAIDDEQIFVAAGRQFQFAAPFSGRRSFQRSRARLPAVERAGDEDALRRWRNECEGKATLFARRRWFGGRLRRG